jgi:hypothetical protein
VEVKELPAITFEMLISSIGGAMGLWTGASIITWIHLIYFCTCMLLKRRRRRKERIQAKVAIQAEADEYQRKVASDEISHRTLQLKKNRFAQELKNNNCVDGGGQSGSIHTESTV